MHQFYVSAKAVILNGPNVLLLQRERDGGRWWNVPGGRLSGQEDIEEGLERELNEELGLTVQDYIVGPLLAANRIPDFPNGVGLVTLLYEVRLVTFPVKFRLSEESVAWAWVARAAAPDRVAKGSGCPWGVRQAQADVLDEALFRHEIALPDQAPFTEAQS